MDSRDSVDGADADRRCLAVHDVAGFSDVDGKLIPRPAGHPYLRMIPVTLLVWLGWFGHEGRANSPQQDLSRYEMHKSRYRWRW